MKELVQQNERLVQSNSLPHLTLEVRNPVDENGLAHLDFVATNAGVGPADIRSVEMFLEGQPVRSSRELFIRCCGVDTREYRRSALQNLMLRPGDSRHYLRLDSRPAIGMEAFSRVHETWVKGNIVSRVCYCSVFDECWTQLSTTDSRPQRVRQCLPPKVAYTS
jgi:hypothetical protein